MRFPTLKNISVQLQILSITTHSCDGFIHTLHGYVNTFTAAFPFKLQGHTSIAGPDINRGILSVPGGVSNQLECCYSCSEDVLHCAFILGFNGYSFLEKLPRASPGKAFFLLLHIILYTSFHQFILLLRAKPITLSFADAASVRNLASSRVNSFPQLYCLLLYST